MKREEILALLYSDFTHSVKDPLWGNVLVTKNIKELLEVEEVEKLSRIKQNGPAYLIYPGSVHTRLEHSIGVYNLSREIIISLASKNGELPLTKEGILSFLISALLHDIGHFPYAHSLKELSIREHEEIAATLIISNEKLRDAIEKTGANARLCASIIDKNIKADNKEVDLYRKILSGTLDPDKLDYLSRDAYFSGVPYGTQNTDYIIKSLDYRDGNIVLDEDAIVSVEHVLFSKYLMYKTIYWHKGVRCATAMIKKALISALNDNVITYDDLYLKDDVEFFSLSKKIDYEPFNLLNLVEHNKLFEKKAELELSEFKELTQLSSSIETRSKAEDMIYSSLKKKYACLKKYECIIDIPEPINFEGSMLLKRKDGSISEIRENESVFNKEVGSLFSSRLRKLSIFLPHYVSLDDLKDTLKENFS